jgi:Rieske Fe-S protein
MDDVVTTDRTDDAPTPHARPFLNRRTVLAGVGAAGVTVFATACSTYGDDANTASSPAPATTGSAAAPSGEATTGAAAPPANAIAKVADIPVGGGKIFEDAGVVITQPEAGTIKAFSNVCTHQGCKVNKVSSTIDCPCHASKFSVTDGSPTAGPAKKALPEKQVTVDGDSIVLA